MENLKRVDKWTVIRTIVLVLALANQILVTMGRSPIPIDDASVELAVTSLWTIISAVASWWYNNNITDEAKQAQAYLNDLKAKKDIDV